MHSPLYGQCRSINNATLAEVKGGLRVWRRRSGGKEEGRRRGGQDKESEVMGKRRKHSEIKKKQMCLFKRSLHLLLQEIHGGFMCNRATQIKSKLAADIFFFITVLVR